MATLVKHNQRTTRKPCRHCNKTGLYWAHDTSRPHDEPCKKCSEREGWRVSGKWVLIEQDGSLHSITCASSRDDTPDDADESPAAKPAAPAATAPPPAALAAFQTLMASLVDRDEIAAMIKAELDSVVFPTRVVVERADGTSYRLEGNTHYKAADVITDLMAGEHVMMVGPAGTGKSTIADQAAEALGLKCYSISCSPTMPLSQLLGYMQATGEYVGSLFRQAYEHGGLFHFDEIDNSHPSILAAINAALANGHMGFPDGMVKRHPKFKCVASANTYGKGADRAYVGRQQIDAATLDRFTIETIGVDETLESDICKATGLGDVEVANVLSFVRQLRANAEAKRMTVFLSPRASVGMCRLLKAGRSWADAVEARVRRGMSDADWSKLNAS